MAVNKGEIGIYGVLRRDGGDGVLANTDLIYDNNKNLTLLSINSDIYVKLGSKVDSEIGKELISSSDNDKLKFIHYDNNILSIGTHYLSASTNTETIIIGIGTNSYRGSCLRIDTGILLRSEEFGDLIVAGSDASDHNIYFGNSDKATYIQSSDAIYVSSGIKGPQYTLRDFALQLQIGNVVEYDSISSSVIFNSSNLPTKIMGSSITLISSSYSQLGTFTEGLYIGTTDNVSIYGNTSINVVSLFHIKNGTGVDIIKAEGTSLVLGNGSYVSADMYMYNYGSNILLSELLNKKYDSTISRIKNTVLAAPTSNDGVATFRKLELSDMPDLSSKYLVLDLNGFLTRPSISGLMAGYSEGRGYIRASIPSDRNEQLSNSWYYATDGSIQNGYSKFVSIVGQNLISDIKDDGIRKIYKLFSIQCPTNRYQTGQFDILFMSRYTNCNLLIAINTDGGYNKTRINVINRNNGVADRILMFYYERFSTENRGDTYVFYGYNLDAYETICYDVTRQNLPTYTFTPINELVDDLPSNATLVSDLYSNLNVKTATKLKTPVTIWGLSFDGSGNVSGNLSIGADKLTFGTSDKYYQFIVGANGLLLGKYTNSDMVVFAPQGTYFGGVSAPTEKVEVNGNVKAKEYLLSDGSKYAEACSESDITTLFN